MKRLTRSSAALSLALTLACTADPTSAAPKLGQIVLEHETGVVRVYDQITIQVRAYDRANQRMAVPLLEWRSENPSIATVEPNGLVTGHGIGDVRVWASAGGVEAKFDLSVHPALLRVALRSGSSVLQVGQTAVLEAKILGSRVPANVLVTWETTGGDVIDVRPVAGSVLPEVEVTSRSVGLARISARSAHGQSVFAFAVASDPVADAPIEITDFHFNVRQFDNGVRALDPSLRLRVSPGRNVQLIRVDIGISGASIVLPPLCASARLGSGHHDILGANNYPAGIDLNAPWRLGDQEPSGLALLTFQVEDGTVRSIAAEGWVDPWGYDWVSGVVSWKSCAKN